MFERAIIYIQLFFILTFYFVLRLYFLFTEILDLKCRLKNAKTR